MKKPSPHNRIDSCDLRYVRDPAVITERVQQAVAKAKPGELIRGGLWEHEMFYNKQWPTRELLDPVAPDNPVVLSRADGHSVLVNSYVIRHSRITKQTRDPTGGEIQHDPATGEPTGIFKEQAENLLKYGEKPVPRSAREKQEQLMREWQAPFDLAARCGVTSIQLAPGGDFEMYQKLADMDKRFAEKRIGVERCKGAYAWRRLLDAGASIAFGTDYPVEPMDPLEGLYAGVTRKDRAGESGDGWFPDQKLSMEEVIRLYTLESARVEFMEDRKGMIREGYLGDVVIYDRDLMTIPHDRIMSAKVDYTIVGGRVVYHRNGVD